MTEMENTTMTDPTDPAGHAHVVDMHALHEATEAAKAAGVTDIQAVNETVPFDPAVPVTGPETPGHAAFHCETCDSDVIWWRIERYGDAVVSWACFTHLPDVCLALQRPDENTRLLVIESTTQ